VVLVAAIPVLANLASLVSLAVLTAFVAALVGFETLRYAEERRRLRDHDGDDNVDDSSAGPVH